MAFFRNPLWVGSPVQIWIGSESGGVQETIITADEGLAAVGFSVESCSHCKLIQVPSTENLQLGIMFNTETAARTEATQSTLLQVGIFVWV